MTEKTLNADLQLTPTIRSKPIAIKALAGQPITLKHELGRVPAGWLVVDRNKAVNVWRSGLMDTKILELTADQDASITVLLL